jgi:hypothetical protein
VGLFCAATAPAQAERPTAPFAPSASVPDHVVTMVGPKPKGITYTIVHHGKWTRVDRDEGPRRITSYYTPGETTDVDIHRDAAGDVTMLQLVRDRTQRPYLDTEPHNTGEHQTLLGETCTVWDMQRTRDTGLAQVSCLTDDGIELWRKYVSPSYGEHLVAEATHVERRPVTADEVRPPRELLSLAWWTRSGPGSSMAPTGPDYETVMRGVSLHDVSDTRTVRRHHPWIYVEETAGTERRRLTITNVATGLRLEFRINDAMVVDQLSITRQPAYDASTKPWLPAHEHDEVLGESCQWFDSPFVATDFGIRECRTIDGVTLKEDTWSRSGSGKFAAVQVARRSIENREVAPPAEIVDPKYWGLD